ncbi:toll/interleukin-1 receptor domain-containing protein [Algoriphagus lutimaris]|uniref:toll/interleukin-1 receptor domain-containing protein n=1 Tax=Algoriphagus lutimaris TaxID=613197 RepID=UPI00196B1A1E|nr:toll/interleukin-1 receptor domain-containing protein [Algoriphagus lutimaris]MBN3522021.1 toll/interleukin-1 receptor domain-containing protein [Algoriphagus lutimaris]
MKDFFISYTRKDADWAIWISKILEEANYSTVLQAKDFRPGSNFVFEMLKAAEANKTIAVYSTNYFASIFTIPEWAAAFQSDPTGEKRIFIPIKVKPCEPPKLVKALVFVDLVGKDRETCKQLILDAVAKENPFDLSKAAFPGSSSYQEELLSPSLSNKDTAERLLEILDTAWTTFQAQAKIRNKLAQKIKDRIPSSKRLQYEEFFHEYFDEMTKDELILHQTIRSYTKNVLKEYNQSALDLIKKHRELIKEIPRLKELKSHLELWLAKFDGIFEHTPSSCLIYVGVEEKKGFPIGIEDELRDYLGDK